MNKKVQMSHTVAIIIIVTAAWTLKSFNKKSQMPHALDISTAAWTLKNE